MLTIRWIYLRIKLGCINAVVNCTVAEIVSLISSTILQLIGTKELWSPLWLLYRWCNTKVRALWWGLQLKRYSNLLLKTDCLFDRYKTSWYLKPTKLTYSHYPFNKYKVIAANSGKLLNIVKQWSAEVICSHH